MNTPAPVSIQSLGAEWPWPTVTDARHRRDPSWWESTEERWSYSLGVLPPVYFPGGFCMGEEADHLRDGTPVYSAWVRVGERCFVRELPLPLAEAEARRLRDHLGAIA